MKFNSIDSATNSDNEIPPESQLVFTAEHEIDIALLVTERTATTFPDGEEARQTPLRCPDFLHLLQINDDRSFERWAAW